MEALPDIDIAVSVAPRTFLDRIATIAEDTDNFIVERHYDALKQDGFDVINLRYQGENAHINLGGQLISRPDFPSRVLVEMRAERWSVNPATRAIYCEAAIDILRPLLRSYNRLYSTRHRLRIAKVGAEHTKISPRTKSLFDQFALLANTASLHPLDWRRFYDLVRESRQELPEEHIHALLKESGFSAEKAKHLADIYSHLWAFKRHK